MKYRVIGIIAGIALIAFLLLRRCDKKIDTQISSGILNPGVIEKIVVDPDTHRMTLYTPGKEQTLYLPDRPSSIEVGKSGQVTVTSRQYGTELKPFGAVGYSDKVRLYAGVDLAYYKRFDVGLFVSGGLNVPVRIGGDVSYNVFSNTKLALGLDNNKGVNFLLAWRF